MGVDFMQRWARPLLLFALAFAPLGHGGTAPRSEFPQSQFQRDRWMSLKGAWDFDFDDADQRVRESWAANHKFTKSIVVPFARESRMSGIGDTSSHPVVWRRSAFTAPADWRGRRVLLHFGAVLRAEDPARRTLHTAREAVLGTEIEGDILYTRTSEFGSMPTGSARGTICLVNL